MENLKKIMASLFRLSEEEIGESTSLENTPAWDSLRHMELIVEIERAFELQLEVDEIVAMINYPAIVKIIKTKCGE